VSIGARGTPTRTGGASSAATGDDWGGAVLAVGSESAGASVACSARLHGMPRDSAGALAAPPLGSARQQACAAAW